jgi:acetoin:2,6-dichlorophenolindophenol oxidoreductase subunit beta
VLRSAIADPDPVIVVENKALYTVKGELLEPAPSVPIGTASTVQNGRDVTIVTYGAMRHVAIEAAEIAAKEGVKTEIIDLRSLQPWDEHAVLESLSRTHRLVVAHEAVEAFGVGAEIAARMADIGFDELDAPIVRVGAPFMPVPFAKPLEERYRPDASRIVDAIKRVLA